MGGRPLTQSPGRVVGGPGAFSQRLEAPQLTASRSAAPSGRSQATAALRPSHRTPPGPQQHVGRCHSAARELPRAGVPGGRTFGPRKMLNYSWESYLQRRTWQLLTFPFHPLSASANPHAPLDLPRLRAVLAAQSGAKPWSGLKRRGLQLRWPREDVLALGRSRD